MLWTGKVHEETGYGSFWFQGRTQGAHRVAYMLAKGPIPSGMFVCHTCDVRHCVNPLHLWLGSARANSLDAKNKGRLSNPRPFRGGVPPRRYGGRNGNSKLDADKVRAIRADPRSDRACARAFGVSARTVSSIRQRLTWAHVE